MTTRHLVHPDLVAMIDALPIGTLDEASLAATRIAMAGLVPPCETYLGENIVHERRNVPGPEGAPDVPLLIYRPKAGGNRHPAYLHMHGGGYVSGLAELNGPGNVRIAEELDCVVVSVDYRLAPETPAPGAVEDCYAALRWLHSPAADDLGIDRSRIAIGGESAGAGLAAALALLARDRGELQICFQLLIYPMLDDRTVTAALPNRFTGEFVWTPSSNRFGWTALLGHAPGLAGVSPYAAAARATELSNLPPAYIAVGALDLFLDEDIAYAQRLLRAGVPTELHIFPGAFHAFEMATTAELVIAAQRERRQALARGLRGNEFKGA